MVTKVLHVGHGNSIKLQLSLLGATNRTKGILIRSQRFINLGNAERGWLQISWQIICLPTYFETRLARNETTKTFRLLCEEEQNRFFVFTIFHPSTKRKPKELVGNLRGAVRMRFDLGFSRLRRAETLSMSI